MMTRASSASCMKIHGSVNSGRTIVSSGPITASGFFMNMFSGRGSMAPCSQKFAMHARIFPGRGSGARSRASPSGVASPSLALRSSAGRSVSKSSMIRCIVSCGVAPGGTASAMLTTPRSVSRPGTVVGLAGV